MQLIAYIVIYPFLWLISILPFKLLYFFSDILYVLLYRVIGYRKAVVKSNLKLVFPEKTDKEISVITDKFYHHLCDMILEAIKSMTISEAQLKKHFAFSNIELINGLEKKGKSVMLICGHYGSWEWIFILQKFVNSKGYAVYKPLENKYFDKLVRAIRAKFNTDLISNKQIISTLIRSKKNKEFSITGFVSDQNPREDKAYYWAPFMGVKVPMHTGVEALSKRLDMAVVFFSVKRLKRGYYETTFKTITEDPKEFKDYEITDIYFELLEEKIKESPEYYLWTHKRWKHKDKVPKEFQ